MSKMGCLLVSCLVLVHASIATAADSGVPFDVFLGGQKVGTETVTTRPGEAAAQRVLHTVSNLKLAGVPIRMETTLRWAEPEGRVLGYTLDANRAGIPQKLAMTVAEGKVVFAAGSGGQTTTREAEVSEPLLVLDNLVAGHYLLFLDRMAHVPSGPARFSVAVPQAMTVIEGAANVSDPETGTFGGRSVPVTVHILQVSNILVTVRSSPDVPDALLEVEVPIQSFRMTRQGFERSEAGAGKEHGPPEGVVSEEVVVHSGPEIALGATLTLPARREGKLPGLVLVHGSGPNDRDETIAMNKPFRDIAEGLSSGGIVVLRYDKRTFALRGSMPAADLVRLASSLQSEVIEDAAASLELLRRRPEVDPDRIFVLGHSLGGLALPYILKQVPWVAGGIVLAGPGRPLDTLTLDQSRYLLPRQGVSPKDAEERLSQMEAAFARVRSGEAKDSENLMGAPVAYWRDVISHEPAEAVLSVPQPVLYLRGSKDYQVTAADQAIWMAAAAGKKKNIAFKVFPGLNHLFMEVEGESDATDYQRPGHVAPAVIREIELWIAEHAGTAS